MKKFRKNCRGFTLVEIIVTFALTALFMSSAALVLSSFIRSHVTASAVAGEQNVATILANKVTDELGAARYMNTACFETLPDESPSGLDTAPAEGGQTEAERAQLLLGKETGADGKTNSVIWYVSGDSGNKVKLCVEDGYLVWTYYVPKSKDLADGYEDPIVWKLGENVYDGCKIESFQVEQLVGERSKPASGSGDGSGTPEGDGDGTSGGDGGTPDGSGSGEGDLINCLKVTIRLVSQRVDNNHFTISRSVECRNLRADNIVTVG